MTSNQCTNGRHRDLERRIERPARGIAARRESPVPGMPGGGPAGPPGGGVGGLGGVGGAGGGGGRLLTAADRSALGPVEGGCLWSAHTSTRSTRTWRRRGLDRRRRRDGEQLRRAAVAGRARAGDRRRAGQPEHAGAAADALPRRPRSAAAPRQPADHLGRLPVVRCRSTVGPPKAFDAEVLLEPLVDRHARVVRPARGRTQRGARLGLGVGPRVGERGPRRPSRRACTRDPCRSRAAAHRGCRRPAHGRRRDRSSVSDVKSAVTSGLR